MNILNRTTDYDFLITGNTNTSKTWRRVLAPVLVLGMLGTGSAPVALGSDARKSLAYAIGEAGAHNPATLKLLRWRAGSTSTVEITLQNLGAYSATSPYNCPKSALILEQKHTTTQVGYIVFE